MDTRCELLAAKSCLHSTLVVRVTEAAIARLLAGDGSRYTLCYSDYTMLATIAAAPSGTQSMANLAKALHFHPSSATRRVRHLLECGLVTKTQDARDDRRYFIALTPEGAALTGRIEGELTEITEQIFATITDEELQAVHSFMDKCAASMQAMLDQE